MTLNKNKRNFLINSFKWFVLINTNSLSLFAAKIVKKNYNTLNEKNLRYNTPWYNYINSYTKYNPASKSCKFFYDLKIDFNTAYYTKGKSISFPVELEIGIYLVTDLNGNFAILYVTSDLKSKSKNKNLVIIPDYTYYAYNSFINIDNQNINFYKSKSEFISTECPTKAKSWYHSPFLNPIDFLNTNKIEFDLILQSEIDHHYDFFHFYNYKNIIIYGHDEYWTRKIRNIIEHSVRENGSKLINLSGNTCYWALALDKRFNSINRSKYGRYHLSKMLNPPHTLLGVSYQWGGIPIKRANKNYLKKTNIDFKQIKKNIEEFGFINQSDTFDQVIDKTNFPKIINPNVCFFKSLNLKKEELLKSKYPILDIEIDGLPLDYKNDVDLKKTNNYHPKNMEVGCSAVVQYGRQTRKIAFMVKSSLDKGLVYSLGSIGWTRSLLQNNYVDQITLNVIND